VGEGVEERYLDTVFFTMRCVHWRTTAICFGQPGLLSTGPVRRVMSKPVHMTLCRARD